MTIMHSVYVDMNRSFLERYAHLTDEELGTLVVMVLKNAESAMRTQPSVPDNLLDAYQHLQKLSSPFKAHFEVTHKQNRKWRKPSKHHIRLYTGILGGFGRFNAAQTGRILRNVMQYAMDGTIPKLTRKERAVFWTMVDWIF